MLKFTRHHRMLGTTALAALMACTLSAPAAKAKSWLVMDEEVETVRGWTIGYSSGFAGCMATAPYKDKTRVWFGYSAKQKYFLVINSPAWTHIKSSTDYNLNIKFTNRGSWNAKFSSFTFNGVNGVATWNLKSAFMEDLASASWLRLYASGTKWAGLSMDGSRAALKAIQSCQSARQERAEADVARAKRRQHADGGSKGGSQPSPAPAAPENKAPKKPQISTGTGFFVTPTGHVVTNNHVTQGCTSIEVGYSGGLLQKATLLAHDRRNDLALLKTDFEPTVVPKLKSRIRVGDNIYVYGFPLSGLLSKTGNFTVGYVTAAAGVADDSTKLQISAPIQPGNSGGPMMDAYGNVVGVIVSKLNVLRVAKHIKDVPQNVNFAIKASLAITFLEAHGIELPGPDLTRPVTDGATSAKLSPADIAARAKQHTLRIVCTRGHTS